MKGGRGRQRGERLGKTEIGEREKEKSTKSNGFEEHISNQFLILAGKKRGRRGRNEKRKSRRRKRGMGSVDMKGFP